MIRVLGGIIGVLILAGAACPDSPTGTGKRGEDSTGVHKPPPGPMNLSIASTVVPGFRVLVGRALNPDVPSYGLSEVSAPQTFALDEGEKLSIALASTATIVMEGDGESRTTFRFISDWSWTGGSTDIEHGSTVYVRMTSPGVSPIDSSQYTLGRADVYLVITPEPVSRAISVLQVRRAGCSAPGQLSISTPEGIRLAVLDRAGFRRTGPVPGPTVNLICSRR